MLMQRFYMKILKKDLNKTKKSLKKKFLLSKLVPNDYYPSSYNNIH